MEGHMGFLQTVKTEEGISPATAPGEPLSLIRHGAPVTIGDHFLRPLDEMVPVKS